MADLTVPEVTRPSADTRAKLAALAAWHDTWVAGRVDAAPFDPKGRKAGSDYNLHFVDIDDDDASFAAGAKKAMAAASAKPAVVGKAATPDGPPAAGQAPPVEPDTRWPAWTVDTAVAAYWAAKIRAALTTGLDVNAVAQAWVRDTAAWKSGDAIPNAVTWLRALGVGTDTIADIIGPVLRDAATVGYSVGSRSAAAALAGDARIGVTVDWSNFKPGSVAAARKVLSEDGMDVALERLLDEYHVTISGIAANRIDELAAVLADGLERGEAPQTIARAIRGISDDPNWALTVAWTETNRAQSTAALDNYRARGVEGKEWFTAHDQRVCPEICKPNEDQGVIPLGDPFQSGDQAPPGHPRCRCAPLPAKLPVSQNR